ncbi:MAG: hypothetical protein H0W38_10255, partial [Methylibium sp.]|nr:hypothetical protein [Methylibium sp.]
MPSPRTGPARSEPPATTPRARRRRRWPWLVVALLVLLPLLLVAALSAAWQSLHTEGGTRWWLQAVAERVPGLTVGDSRGALLGAEAEFMLDRASMQTGDSTVRVDGLRIEGLQFGRWQLRAPYVHVEARAIALRQLDVETTPSTEPSPAPEPPRSLRLPATARVDVLRIDRLRLPGLATPIKGLTAHLEAGATHRIDALALRWNGLLAEGSAHIDADSPMSLRSSLAVRADAADAQPAPAGPGATALPEWARGLVLQVAAGGPLERFDVTASLELQDQRLNAKAQVTPFAALPLSQLDARFAQLDLAPLLAPFTPQAPTTALTGSAVLQLAADAPLSVRAQIANTMPGRWDQQRVPVRELELRASGQGADWQIDSASVQLAGDAGTPAGQLEGSGRIDGGVGAVELSLDGVLLQQLDRRAPPLRLSGPIRLKHTPDAAGPAAPTAPAAPASAAVPPIPPSTAPSPAFGRLEFDTKITGALVGAARKQASGPLRDAVQLALNGSATPSQIVLKSLSARAGAARLDGQGSARRVGNAWDSEAALKLAAFDPRLWLPGEPDAAWRRAKNVLNGQVDLKARVPADAADAAAMLARLNGTLRAELTDSALAGQPVALTLQAEADGRGRLNAEGQTGAAGNAAQFTLQLQVPAGRSAAPGGEQFGVRLDAPALARLAPLAELFGLGPLSGQAQLDARVEGGLGAALLGGAGAGAGAGGTLTTQGSLELKELQAGTLQLDSADADWNATLPAGAAGSAATE